MEPRQVGKLVWVALLLGLCLQRFLAERGAPRDEASEPLGALGVLARLAALSGLVVAPGIYLASDALAPFDWPVAAWKLWFGLGAGLAASLLVLHSYRTLAKARGEEGQALVTSGPYAHVRHPVASGWLLWGVAQALLLPNDVAGPAGLGGLVIYLLVEIPREERRLFARYGDDYARYWRRTGALWPGKPKR